LQENQVKNKDFLEVNEIVFYLPTVIVQGQDDKNLLLQLCEV